MRPTASKSRLKEAGAHVQTLFDRYVGTQEGTHNTPWCLLDTHHRHMERRCHTFDFDLSGGHDTLEQLVSKARERYMQVGGALAERFLRSYHGGGFKIAERLRQVETFELYVKPRLAAGKIAYVWVDALRYEMAAELAEALADDFAIELQAAVGTAPTVTEIGMAALLPGAAGAAIVPAGESKLALRIGDVIIKDRKDRIAYLKASAGVSVTDVKLDDLLPSPKKKVRDAIRDAGLVLVTTQEIDALAEGDNIPLARRTMDDVLHELRRAFRVLADLGVKTIVVAADHGYLFGDELGDDMKIDPPGGETADLHRRVWVGRGGSGRSRLSARANLADFGLGGGPGDRRALELRLLQGQRRGQRLLPRWAFAAGADRPGADPDAQAREGSRPRGRDQVDADARQREDQHALLLGAGQRRGRRALRADATEGAGRGARRGQAHLGAGQRVLWIRGGHRGRAATVVGRIDPQKLEDEHCHGDDHRRERRRRP